METIKKIIPFVQLNLFGAEENDLGQRAGENVQPAEAAPITLNPERISLVIAASAAALLAVCTALQLINEYSGGSSWLVGKAAKLFSVDRELNVPAFFSTLLLLFSSLLLALITFLRRKQRAAYTAHWATLALGFLVMAFDEIVAVHERLIEPMRAVLGEKDLGVFYFAWVVPGIALVLFLAAMFLRFWWNLPVRTRLHFLIAGFLYLGGAIGVELINGNYAEIHGKDNFTYVLLATLEEGLEMAGIIVFIRTLLRYIADSYRILQFRF